MMTTTRVPFGEFLGREDGRSSLTTFSISAGVVSPLRRSVVQKSPRGLCVQGIFLEICVLLSVEVLKDLK